MTGGGLGKKAAGTSSHAFLLLVQPEAASSSVEIGRRYDLIQDSYIISNTKEADIQLPNQRQDPYGIRLYKDAEEWSFETVVPSTQVRLNEFPNIDGSLHDGDVLQVGQTYFKFLSGMGLESAFFEALYTLIRVDAHTGAYNKAHFWESLELWMSFADRFRQPLGLVVFDIDHFKKLNTEHGHLTADIILKKMAQRVRKKLRKVDIFCRYGGEEFVLILPKTSLEQARTFAEKVRMVIGNEPFVVHDKSIPVTISAGVAVYEKEPTANDLFDRVDQYLRVAKDSGRNRVVG